jgi:hypothetical protein
MDGGTQVLQRVHGSVEVALDMIARSKELYASCDGNGLVLGGLADAAEALRVVTLAVSEQLRTRTPAA